ASTKSFNKFISFFPYFKCEHLWLTAAYVNRCIHNKPRKRGTDRRLSKKVMTDGLNNLTTKLTVTHQSTMCTTSHLNLVIWQNQSIGKSFGYGATTDDAFIRTRLVERLFSDKCNATRCVHDDAFIEERF